MMQKHFSILAAALCTAAFFGGTSECSAYFAVQYDTQEINKLVESMKESLTKQSEQIELCKTLLKKIETKAAQLQDGASLAGTIPPPPPLMTEKKAGEVQDNTPQTGTAVPPPPSLVPPPPPANVPPPPVFEPGVTTAKKGSTDLQSAIQNAKLKKTETKTTDKAPGSFVDDIAAGKVKLKKSIPQRTSSAPAAFGGVDNELAKAIAKRRQKVESQK